MAVMVFMGGLAWASVPLSRLVLPRSPASAAPRRFSEQESDTILDQTIRVRFDASRARATCHGSSARCSPTWTSASARRGLAFYEAYNPTDEPVAGTAFLQRRALSRDGRLFRQDRLFLFRASGPATRRASSRCPVTFNSSTPPSSTITRPAGHPAITLSYTFHVTGHARKDYAALDVTAPVAPN